MIILNLVLLCLNLFVLTQSNSLSFLNHSLKPHIYGKVCHIFHSIHHNFTLFDLILFVFKLFEISNF